MNTSFKPTIQTTLKGSQARCARCAATRLLSFSCSFESWRLHLNWDDESVKEQLPTLCLTLFHCSPLYFHAHLLHKETASYINIRKPIAGEWTTKEQPFVQSALLKIHSHTGTRPSSATVPGRLAELPAEHARRPRA